MWVVLALAGLVIVALGLRWLISAVWVAFISNRWNVFDSEDKSE